MKAQADGVAALAGAVLDAAPDAMVVVSQEGKFGGIASGAAAETGCRDE